MKQPTMDLTSEHRDTDTTGRRWSHALVDNKARLLAGYDETGAFHCYVDSETLFAHAMAMIVSLKENR